MNDSLRFDETIVAIASPTSPALRGVVRLSGEQCSTILHRMKFGDQSAGSPSRSTHQIDLGELLGAVEVDVLHWPGKRSYTGQPSAELHTFGALPILESIVHKAVAAGARAARPGEFTLRSFLAGRLDLTQAEAVLGVIDAEHPGSLDDALSQLAGNLSGPLNQIRDELLDLLADVEAGLDFVDEDIEFIDQQTLTTRLEQLLGLLTSTADQLRSRDGVAPVVPVVLCGEPNAGKSCLLNRLTGQAAAIVSQTVGTTRDVVSVEMSIGQRKIQLYDTAGLESIDDVLRQAAQKQTAQAISQSMIRLWCIDAGQENFPEALDRLCEQVQNFHRQSAVDLLVLNKSDLNGSPVIHDHAQDCFETTLSCAAINGQGVQQIAQTMVDWIDRQDREQTGSIIGTAARCRQSIHDATAAIRAAIEQIAADSGHEFVSAELRIAAQCIGEVTGEFYNEDILDRVFGRFCIGK